MKALQQAVVRALGLRVSVSDQVKACSAAKSSADCCWRWVHYHDL
jgi:hypothetical protein